MAHPGVWNAGQYAALLASEILGLKLVPHRTRKEESTTRKASIEKVVDYKLKTGSLQGFSGADPISNADLLEFEGYGSFPFGP